jgi:hypothetical protein
MSDEAQVTPAAATKSLFGTAAFILLLLGAEMIAEKDGPRWGTGIPLLIAGGICTYAAVFWNFVRTKLPKAATVEINAIATSPRWWFGTLLTLLWVIIFMPIIQAPRWPSLPFSRVELTTIPTTLRLQFNAVDKRPEEIEARNIHWTVANYDEQRKQSPDRKYVCDSPPPPNFGVVAPSLLGDQNCAYRDIPSYHEVINTILFLTFDRPISAKQIKLNPHGADLPKWDAETLNDKLATIYFHGDMAHMILDIEVTN